MNKLNKFWLYCFIIFFSLVPILFINLPIWLTIITLGLIIFICTKFNIKKFPIIIFILSFLIRLIFNLYITTIPNADFQKMYEGAASLVAGDFSCGSNDYFSLYPYQIGFSGFQALLLLVHNFLHLHNSLLFLKIINCVISSLIVILIYFISKEFVKEKSAQIVASIYAFLPFTITHTSVLTNHHFSSLLIYFSIYLLVSKKIKMKNIYKYLISGILIGISDTIRPEGIIPIFSIIIYLILTSNNPKDDLKIFNGKLKKYFNTNWKKTLYKSVQYIGIILISYCGTLALANSIYIGTGIETKGLKNLNPYYKFVVGFNYKSNGEYNLEDMKILHNKKNSIKLIKKRVFTNPIKIANLFKNKINIFWNKTTLYWSTYEIENKKVSLFNNKIKISNITHFFEQYNNYIMFIMYILVIIGILHRLKMKNFDTRLILLINQVFVTFGVFLLIEVQPRYSYFIQISILILASLGIEWLLDTIKKDKNLK